MIFSAICCRLCHWVLAINRRNGISISKELPIAQMILADEFDRRSVRL
ncbi:hypothetical protein Z949_365 [Sulfitobacter guttiformis KCTC 32187]|nr:hypothetical protein Z949_365 [Sulfitobacter guttiformis KCTC 32187]